jgi:hypothetical protein
MHEFYCWACDLSKNTGEGNLANLFIKKNIKNNFKIFTVKDIKIKNNFFINIINYRYISPFIGVIFCWFFFLKKKKIVYINYLPLWNFIIFMLLPPKTILGPITGGANYNKKQFFIRHFIFPMFYKISEMFLNFRKTEIYFSTDLLKKYLSNLTINKSKFNYIFNYYSKTIKKKKSIDFLIYYRKHTNKESLFPYKLIKKLIALNFKIHLVGDYFKNSNVINHGYINNKKVNNLLSKTHFSLSSNENLYTLFTMECINNHVKIIINKSQRNDIKFFKRNFFFINFNTINLQKNYINNLKYL